MGNRTTCLVNSSKLALPGETEALAVHHLVDTNPVRTYNAHPPSGEPEVFNNMVGTQNGTSVIDSTTGWPVTQTIKLHYEGEKVYWRRQKHRRPERMRILYTIDSSSTITVATADWGTHTLAANISASA